MILTVVMKVFTSYSTMTSISMNPEMRGQKELTIVADCTFVNGCL